MFLQKHTLFLSNHMIYSFIKVLSIFPRKWYSGSRLEVKDPWVLPSFPILGRRIKEGLAPKIFRSRVSRGSEESKPNKPLRSFFFGWHARGGIEKFELIWWRSNQHEVPKFQKVFLITISESIFQGFRFDQKVVQYCSFLQIFDILLVSPSISRIRPVLIDRQKNRSRSSVRIERRYLSAKFLLDLSFELFFGCRERRIRKSSISSIPAWSCCHPVER